MPAQPSGPRTEKRPQTMPSTTPQASKERARPAVDAEQIARRAYERFEARGAEHGRDQEDWFNAEQELTRGE